MSRFPIHTLDSAPDQSKARLTGLAKAVGMLPNLAAGMAESPALLDGFLSVREIYQKSTLSGAEIQAVSLTAAHEHESAWCMAFHSLMAAGEGVSEADIQLLRTGRTPVDARLGPLTDFARAMLQRRGAVSEPQLRAFLDAAYTPRHALDVVLGLAFSLMANYAAYLVQPPLDAPLQQHAWHLDAAIPAEPEPTPAVT